MPSDQFEFAAEETPLTPASDGHSATWKVLLVDDDPDIHNVTRLALAGLAHADRPLELHSAESAEQAGEMLEHIRSEMGITIIWVEHIMGILMKVVDRCGHGK